MDSLLLINIFSLKSLLENYLSSVDLLNSKNSQGHTLFFTLTNIVNNKHLNVSYKDKIKDIVVYLKAFAEEKIYTLRK